MKVSIATLVNLLQFAMCFEVKPRSGVYNPTEGEVWPLAKEEVKGGVLYLYSPFVFQFQIINKNCKDLKTAIDRCRHNINILENIARSQRNFSYGEIPVKKSVNINIQFIKKLKINMRTDCSLMEYPFLDMDESYNLTVSRISTLNASSIWGVIRGLETFSQLFYLSKDYEKVIICSTDIVDSPFYKHRGLMLDTSSHYISVDNIMKTLDAMAVNKLNVLHWRIVGDKSFPYQSLVLPELSAKGAFAHPLVYNDSQIRMIQDHARKLGIRIVPEFNIPGHSKPFGRSHPEILTVCDKGVLGPMDPVNNETYELLDKLFREIQDLFHDQYLHLGGDGIDLNCWENNPEIQEFMAENGMKSAIDLRAYFYWRVTTNLRKGTSTIVRQESYYSGVALPNNTIVELNKYHSRHDLLKLLRSPHRKILTKRYKLKDMVEFTDLYDCEDVPDYSTLLRNVVGGEVVVSTETVDDNNLMSYVWPSASAVAEVLWSMEFGTCDPMELSGVDVYKARRRLEEHWCRMKRRGIMAQPPSGAGFCVQ